MAAIVIAAADLLIDTLTEPGTGAGRAGSLLASLQTAAVVLTPALIAPTVIRVLAHPGPTPMPVTAARATVAGVTASLCCTVIGLLAGLGSALTVMIGGHPATDVATWLIAALLVVGAVAATVAARLLQQAWSGWSPSFTARARLRDPGRPDLIDDLSTLLARLLPGSATARTGAWLNRRLDDWAWSPRRHRTGFVLIAGCAAGVVLTGWHASAFGPWSGLLAPLAFAALVTGLVTAALGAGVAWLGLLRPQPRTS
ncbi:MAG TPA: hypothetical protein VHN80_00675 [Kineosporiaceae bacterium]|nr:hypothetical protein [Kineosporiaceae bacterium]